MVAMVQLILLLVLIVTGVPSLASHDATAADAAPPRWRVVVAYLAVAGIAALAIVPIWLTMTDTGPTLPAP